jgi:uncharacterized LabA/DUF88 family protein
MANHSVASSSDEQDPLEATLVFHEQADGRKVARLPGGKIVLVDLRQIERVRDGDAWFVKLRHRDTFAIADPVEKVTRATLEASGGLTSGLGDALARALRATPARESAAGASGPGVATSNATVLQEPRAGVAALPAVPAPPSSIDVSRILRVTDRVALFVDGANTDWSARAAGYFLDFRKAREFFHSHATFYAGFYYVADFTTSDPLQQRFFDFLSYAGFIVRRRPVKVITDQETGERIIKGNLDTEIVLDMMNTEGNYDVAFLFSGDSDFERAVDLLRSRGKRVYVVSARAQLSRELAYVSDKPIFYLEDHRALLARTDREAVPG